MENSNVDITKTDKKNNSLIIITIIIIVIVLTFQIGKRIYGYEYRSTDLKSDQEVNDYLVKYIKNKYDADVKLSLENKELIYICTFRMIDGSCMKNADNKDIYEYKFYGVDSNNNDFVIKYTNSYIGRNKKYKAKIVDNYNIYYKKNKLEKAISKYSKNIDIYSKVNDGHTVYNTTTGDEEIADNYLVVRMYVNKIDTNSICKLIKKVEKFDEVRNVIITSDKEVYSQILLSKESYTSEYRIFQEEGFYNPNILNNKFGYTYIEKKDGGFGYFLSEFENFEFDNNSNYYSILYYGGHFQIYQKQK